MGSQNSTAKDGINKIIKNQSLIIKYLNKSVIYKNYMNTRCTKVIIPGKEIEQNSSFYIYNIEGFFDIEKGIYFSLIKLLESMQFLEENKISINSYEDLEEKVNTFLSAIQIVNCICNFSIKNEDKSLEYEGKCQCTKIIEEKKTENIKLDLGFFSWNKTEEKTINEIIKVEEQETIKEEIKNFDFTNIPNYVTLILITMKLLGKTKIFRYLGINNAINFLRNIIPFNELHEILSCTVRVISGTINGMSHIFKGITSFPTNKVLSIVNLATGVLELSKSGIDIFVTTKKIENKKNNIQYTKAQDNFRSLLIQMDDLFTVLINSNLEELKNNNIIILGIDESDNSYNEGTDLQLFNIENIDTFAKCLSESETDRAKYIQNMIHFYSKITPKLSELTERGENEKKLSLDFLLSLQEFIINNCNNQDFWIKVDKKTIEKFIDLMKKEYEKGKKYFKNNSNEIKNKFIKSLEKKSKIRKNKTFNIKKNVYIDKECESPAPIVDIKNTELKSSRKKKYIRKY